MEFELSDLDFKINSLSPKVERLKNTRVVWQEWEDLLSSQRSLKSYYYDEIYKREKENESKYQILKTKFFFVGNRIETCFLNRGTRPILKSSMEYGWYSCMCDLLYYYYGLVYSLNPDAKIITELNLLKSSLIELELVSQLSKEKREFWRLDTIFRGKFNKFDNMVRDLLFFKDFSPITF